MWLSNRGCFSRFVGPSQVYIERGRAKMLFLLRLALLDKLTAVSIWQTYSAILESRRGSQVTQGAIGSFHRGGERRCLAQLQDGRTSSRWLMLGTWSGTRKGGEPTRMMKKKRKKKAFGVYMTLSGGWTTKITHVFLSTTTSQYGHPGSSFN